jgi:hypothetical protein
LIIFDRPLKPLDCWIKQPAVHCADERYREFYYQAEMPSGSHGLPDNFRAWSGGGAKITARGRQFAHVSRGRLFAGMPATIIITTIASRQRDVYINRL